MRRIYLDHNATTELHPRARRAMAEALESGLANPSSLHAEGRRSRRFLEGAREEVAEVLRVHPDELVFTSGATEANALALQALAGAGKEGAIVTTAVEHPSIRNLGPALCARGAPLRELPVDSEGRLDLEVFEEALRDGARGAALLVANNETGTLLALEGLAERASRVGRPLHADAVQWPGKRPLADWPEGLSSLAFSAHKFGGPPGIGALVLRRGHPFKAGLAVGGGQEQGRRGGTENLLGALGFAVAARALAEEEAERLARLTALEGVFLSELDRAGIAWERFGGSDPSRRLPGTLALRLPGIAAETLAMALDLEGVAVSIGSACSSGAMQPSHVLSAMGVPLAANLETIRVSLGPSNTEEEMREVVARLLRVLARNP